MAHLPSCQSVSRFDVGCCCLCGFSVILIFDGPAIPLRTSCSASSNVRAVNFSVSVIAPRRLFALGRFAILAPERSRAHQYRCRSALPSTHRSATLGVASTLAAARLTHAAMRRTGSYPVDSTLEAASRQHRAVGVAPQPTGSGARRHTSTLSTPSAT